MRLNPLSGLIDGIRNPLLQQQLDPILPVYSLAVATGVLLVALWAYRRVRPQLVEFL